MTPAQLAKLLETAAAISERLYSEGVHQRNEFRRNDEAAKLACTELKVDLAWREPVYYLLQYTWNDILAWAKEHKEGQPGDTREREPPYKYTDELEG